MALNLGHKAKHLAERAKRPLKEHSSDRMMGLPAIWMVIALATLGLGALVWWIISSSDNDDDTHEWEE